METRSAAPVASPSAGTAARGSRRWLILAVICLAYLMDVLDVTIMNLALPSAQDDLGFTDADRQWIVTAYAVAFGSLLLFCGRLVDLVGRKEIFLVGLVGFAVASAAGGAATNFEMLVTARAGQGIFAALMAPAALALLSTVFWWCAGIFAAGAVICGLLLRGGPLPRPEWGGPSGQAEPAPEPSQQAAT